MGIYKYETHMHCSESSGCAKNTGAEMAEFYAGLGYAGVIVTDHVIPDPRRAETDEAWAKYCERITAGYKACLARGRELGLDVFYGWEYSSSVAHFLIYGLSPDWHTDKPESMSWDAGTYLDRVRADGAYIVHAHPFRENSEPIWLFPSRTDGCEVLSAARADIANERAGMYAESYGLVRSAGSDCHSVKWPRLCGVESDRRLESIEEFIALLKSGAEIFDDRIQQ